LTPSTGAAHIFEAYINEGGDLMGLSENLMPDIQSPQLVSIEAYESISSYYVDLILTFNEDLDYTSTSASAFDLKINGVTVAVLGASRLYEDYSQVKLMIDFNPFETIQSLALDYVKPSSGDLFVDLSGNEVQSFTDATLGQQLITNTSKGTFTNFKSHVLSIFDDANDAFSTMSPQSSTLSSETVFVSNSGLSFDQEQVTSG